MPRIVIVGPTSSGRSTVGQALADLWGVPFSETEQYLEKPLSALMTEDPFAATEAIICAGLEQLDASGVVTLLPTAAMDPRIAAKCRELGVPVVRLTSPISELARRANLGAPRTAALGTPRALFASMVRDFEEKVQTYQTFQVDTSDTTPQEAAATIRDTMTQEQTTTE